MGKFVGRTTEAGGGIGVVTPQEQLQEATPQVEQAPSSGGDPLLNQIIAEQAGQAPASAPVPQETVDQIYEDESLIAAEQERQRVPTIAERREATQAPIDRYQPLVQEQQTPTAKYGDKADGGLMDRARDLSNAFETGEIGLNVNQVEGQARPMADALNNISAVSTRPDGTFAPDPRFGAIAALVTENTIGELAASADHIEYNKDENQYYDVSGVTPQPIFIEDQNFEPTQKQFTTESGNVRLGKEIAREWQRYNNQQQGLPSDQYQDISSEDASILGDVAKKLWAKRNPDLIKPLQAENGQLYLQLTPDGVQAIAASAAERKRLFPKQHVRPQKIKPVRGELVGEGKKLRKKTSGVGKREGTQVLQQAMSNLSEVPNVVDKQRLKIGFATILPVLGAQTELDPGVLDTFGDIHSVGPKKLAEFNVKADDPQLALQDLKRNVAQQVMGTAMEREGANFLTYYMQTFNGRIAPQQTNFDPTSGKFTRFVTRNAVPAMMRPGSRVEKNLRQMYAMMLVKGADTKLPAERERMLDAAAGQMEQWGNRLQLLLDQSMTDAEVEAIAEAIEQGIPVNSPKFPPVKGLQLDPQQDADLINAIRSKGEDGPHYIDGLIDFAKYNKWKRDQKDPTKVARPFSSYFNAYMDGKTNGIASNGLQMGDINIATATGVMRQSTTDLLDEGDVRDQLKEVLLGAVDINGWHGLEPQYSEALSRVARKVYGIRDLNKSTTMTMGYGQNLEAFRDTIDEFMQIESQQDTELAQDVALLDENLGHGELVEALHKQYVIGLASVFGKNTLRSRDLMQGAAVTAALFDKPLKFKSYIGLDLIYGGTRPGTRDEATSRTYTIYDNKTGKAKKQRVYDYKDTISAAAYDSERGVGGAAEGGAIPGPIQSLDAATVALTASGKSWAKLKKASNGNPYLHTVYDAFKVDAMGYDVVLEEVNANWLKAGLEWSYLHEMDAAIEGANAAWLQEFYEIPKEARDTPESADVNTRYAKIGDLLFKKENRDGKMTQGRLFGTLMKYMDGLDGLDNDDAVKLVGDAMRRINVATGFPKDGPAADADKVLTPNQAKKFIDAFIRETEIRKQIKHMAMVTDHKKKTELEPALKKGGNVYQYYAH